MPSKSANVKDEKQYEKLKKKGMSKSWAARIASSPGASNRGGKKSGSGSSPKQGGTTAQKKKAGVKGGARMPRARSKPRRMSARHALVASCNMITATEVCPLSGG